MPDIVCAHVETPTHAVAARRQGRGRGRHRRRAGRGDERDQRRARAAQCARHGDAVHAGDESCKALRKESDPCRSATSSISCCRPQTWRRRATGTCDVLGMRSRAEPGLQVPGVLALPRRQGRRARHRGRREGRARTARSTSARNRRRRTAPACSTTSHSAPPACSEMLAHLSARRRFQAAPRGRPGPVPALHVRPERRQDRAQFRRRRGRGPARGGDGERTAAVNRRRKRCSES